VSRDCTRIFLLFLAALVLTLPTVGLRDITTSHEGRVAQTARQMAAAGWPWNAERVLVPDVGWRIEGEVKRLEPDPKLPPLQVNPWIVPVIGGQARLQKPPLPYWVTAVMFKLFGVNEWAARAVPAMMGALLTLIVADLARILIHRRMAVWAAGIWISSYFVFDEFRKCMADPYVAFFAMAAVWAWARAASERKSFHVLLFYAVLGLGFIAKGPAVFAFAIPGAIAASWSIKRRPAASIVTHLFGVVLLLLIALPWYLVVWRQVPNAVLLWKYESIGGFGDKNEKPQPIWFYLPQLFLITLPWTPLWIAGIVVAARRFQKDGFALLWLASAVLIFSVITQKKNAYLLPATAAQTLLATQGLRWLFATGRLRNRRPVAAIIGLLALGIAIGFTVNAELKENLRSAKAVGEEVARVLSMHPEAELDTSSLPADAAFYLPLRPARGSNVQWIVVDDRPNKVTPESPIFRSNFRDRTIASVNRVPLQSSPADFRWKVFEVRLEP